MKGCPLAVGVRMVSKDTSRSCRNGEDATCDSNKSLEEHGVHAQAYLFTLVHKPHPLAALIVQAHTDVLHRVLAPVISVIMLRTVTNKGNHCINTSIGSVTCCSAMNTVPFVEGLSNHCGLVWQVAW